MRIIRIITICVLGFIAVIPEIAMPLAGQQTAGKTAPSGSASSTPSFDVSAAVSAGKFTLADFAWLSGRWQGQWGPRIVEQEWTPPEAGMMVGVYRVIENGKTLVVELLAISEAPDGIEYRIRHFTPTLAAWEKSGSSVLTLASMDAKRIVFENSLDGQPKHAILDRVDEDTFVSRSEIVPLEGNSQVVSITFRRQKPALKKP